MKRLTLWIASVTLLMFLSVTSALQSSTALRALDKAELAAVTGGICNTCPVDEPPNDPYPTYPTVVSEDWERVSSHTSSPTVASRSPVQTYKNGGTMAQHIRITFSNECRRVITGGSLTLARSLGITLNSVYHCAQTEEFNFSVPPKSSVTLYSGTMRTYTTTTYRQVLRWSDGYREITGATDTVREETTYTFLETR